MTSSPAQSASSTLSQRATAWATENRRVLLGVAAGAVVVGGGYYLYTANQTSSRKPKKSSSRRAKLASLIDGKKSDASLPGSDLEKAATAAPVAGGSEPQDVMQMSAETIAALPPSRRKELATELKSRGNKQYQARKYEAAADLYTQAIACEERAVFYSNRAACYTNLNKVQEVIDDCDAALRLDHTYIKALSRRASAYELVNTEDSLFKSVCDFTAACILEQFQNNHTTRGVERVLQMLSAAIATRLVATREPQIPSPSFVRAYLDAFRPRAKPALPESPSTGDRTLLMAFEALDAKDYHHATSLFNESVEQGFSTNELHARALNMRGTLRFIMGMSKEALEDLDFATNLEPSDTQTWVKKASVHMELGQHAEAMTDFETALKINPNDPDVYYHRGQVYFIMERWTDAIAEYKRSMEIDDTFIFSQIQHAVALYKDGKKHSAAQTFRKYVRQYRDSPEVHNYYGELLLDTEQYSDAFSQFDTAIALEKKSTGPANILPIINKALCLFKWKQDVAGAEALLKEALDVDPQSDNAIMTYAHLLQEAGRVREAVDMYAQAVKLARNTKEMEQWIGMEQATKAQIHFMDTYPEEAAKLGLADPARVNGTSSQD